MDACDQNEPGVPGYRDARAPAAFAPNLTRRLHLATGVILAATLIASLAPTSLAGEPAPDDPPPCERDDYRERRACCDSLVSFYLQELPRLWQAGERRRVRLLADRWRQNCRGSVWPVAQTALGLLLAALDDSLTSYRLPPGTIHEMQLWRDPRAPEGAGPTAFRAFVGDLAAELRARRDLDREDAFVGEYYGARSELPLSALADARYRGTRLRKEYLLWQRDRRVTFTLGIGEVAFGQDVVTWSAIDLIKVSSEGKDGFYYRVSPFGLLSGVFWRDPLADGSHAHTLTLTGLVRASLWGLANLSTRLFLDEDLPTDLSPFRYVFCAPSSSVGFRLGNKLWFSLGSWTEYVLVRGKHGERGILTGPRIGLVRGGDPSHGDWEALSVTFGPQYWWSFEGTSRWRGWALGVGLAGLGN